jgi:hypothetical protein
MGAEVVVTKALIVRSAPSPPFPSPTLREGVRGIDVSEGEFP